MSKITIEIDNINSKIVGDLQPEIFMDIKQALSYVVAGAQFSTYAQQGWDGTKYLFIGRTKSFPTGLLRRVREVLAKYNVPYEILDKRVKPTGFPIIFKNVKLRDYQEECVKEMVRVGRGLIQVGTSGGKTIVTSALLANLGVNSLVIVPTRELLKQTAGELSKFLGINVGIIGEGKKDIGKITVATFQSLTTSEDTKKRKFNPDTKRWTMVDDKKLTIRPDLKEYLESVECLYSDECFPEYTKVHTKRGIIPISEVKKQDSVLSFDTKHKYYVYKPVVRLFKKIYRKPLYKITLDNNREVFCTHNHPFYIVDTSASLLKFNKINAEALKIGYTAFLVPDGWDNPLYTGKAFEQVKIAKVEHLKEEHNNVVYNIEVKDTHTYFANNILVSNCHHLAAGSLQQIYDACPNAYYRYGCSATPFHDSDEDILIEAVTGRVLKKFSASYLIAHEWISRPTIHLLPFKQDKLPKGKTYAQAYSERIINSKHRNSLVVKIAEKEADKNNSVLISVRQINHGEIIYDLLKSKYKKKVVFLNSKVAASEISKTLQKLSKKQILIVIATSLLNEGVNVPSLDTLIFASAPKSPIVTIQLVGRVLRRTETKNTVNVYDIQDYGCKYFGNASKERRDIYATEPEFVLQQETQST